MNVRLGGLSLCRSELLNVKRRALRRGIWFRVLSRVERVQIDLTIRIVDRVRSSFLARVLRPILGKLLDALESPVKRLMKTVGKTLARKISEIGEKLGCKPAGEWAKDSGFIQFLTIMYMNTPRLYRTNYSGSLEE